MLLNQRRADESQKGKRIRFAPIFSLVVYHGEHGWTVSRKFIDLFDVPEALNCYIPDFEYWLCDLTNYSDEEIIGQALLQICLRVLKYSRSEEITFRLPEIIQLFQEITSKRTALEVLYTVLRYLSNNSANLTKEQLIQVVEEVFEQGGDTMTTIAQQLRMEGEEIGLMKGLAKRQEEVRKAEQKVQQMKQRAWQSAFKHIHQILTFRFEMKLDQYNERLEKLKLSALEKLTDLAFQAKTLAEFEVELSKLEAPPDNSK